MSTPAMSDPCPICFESFDSEMRLKTTLDCQHRFCLSCLYTFIKDASGCPLCKKAFTEASVKACPSEAAVPSANPPKVKKRNEKIKSKLLEAELATRSDLEDCIRKLAVTKQKLINLKELEVELEETKKSLQGVLESMRQTLKLLDERTDDGEDESGQSLTYVEAPLHRWTRGDAGQPCSIGRAEFKTVEEYVREVRTQLERGETVFSKHSRADGVLYSEVFYIKEDTNWSEDVAQFRTRFPRGCIAVGSLTPKAVDEANVLITPFEDLKQSTGDRIFAFVDFQDQNSVNQRCFSRLNSSPLAQQFLTLCTGEEGDTYADTATVGRGSNCLVAFYPSNRDVPWPSEKYFNYSPRVLTGRSNRNFGIDWSRNYHNYSSQTVLGAETFLISSPSAIRSSQKTIRQCGFVLKCE